MLIIDAYNLLNVQGVLPMHLAGLDLVELVSLIGHSRHASDRVLVVCDGHLSHLAERLSRQTADPVQVQFGGVELLFSGVGSEADDVIEALLAHHAGSNDVLMVSSDKRLVRAARRTGAQPMSSDAFLRRLTLDHDAATRPRSLPGSRQTPLNRDSLAYWMREFDLGEPVESAATPETPLENEQKRSEAEDDSEVTETPQERVVDELLVRLIRESRLSIDLVDLDMDRWLREHPPE